MQNNFINLGILLTTAHWWHLETTGMSLHWHH